MKSAVHVYWFVSSSGKETYETIRYDDGSCSCSCPGWCKRNPPSGRTCRHTRAVLSGCGAAMSKQHGAIVNGKFIDDEQPGAAPAQATPKPQRRFNFEVGQ